MKTKIALALIAIATIAAMSCASQKTAATSKLAAGNGGGKERATERIVHPTWLGAGIEGDTVSIPTKEVDDGQIVHFRISVQNATLAFMAYKTGGETFVRASVCPPCGSQSFSLVGDILECNTCRSRFEARTGKGIGGACKDYPKAGVVYSAGDGVMTMKMADLATAYEATQRPG